MEVEAGPSLFSYLGQYSLRGSQNNLREVSTAAEPIHHGKGKLLSQIADFSALFLLSLHCSCKHGDAFVPQLYVNLRSCINLTESAHWCGQELTLNEALCPAGMEIQWKHFGFLIILRFLFLPSFPPLHFSPLPFLFLSVFR